MPDSNTTAATAVTYRHVDSPLGPMIAGATGSGVCFLEWHDRGGVPLILERVRKRYRCETVEGNSPHLDQLERELGEYFAGQRQEFEVAVDVNGTPFERRTWALLRSIPYGATWSYGEMARRLGKPGAARAVGRANGANYLSIVIPCHRVIEANGKLRGYGGGLWRKQRLLDMEAGRQVGAA